MKSFWHNLRKPIIGLAPMDGVTDPAMRHIQAQVAKPDVLFTEQISVEALAKAPEKIAHRLNYTPKERPIVCQLSGYNPSYFRKAAQYVISLGFDGIDINLGCPVKPADKHGGHRGAGLIGKYEVVEKIISHCTKALSSRRSRKSCYHDSNHSSRVAFGFSLKTRLTDNSRKTIEWVSFLSKLPIDALILHGRTLKQGFRGQSDWDEIAKMAKVAQQNGKIFLGNGDVTNAKDAKAKCTKYGLDGVLIGRAAMGDPWVFANREASLNERLKTMLQHARYFDQIRGDQPFTAIRKQLGWYCQNFAQAKKLRALLVRANDFSQVSLIVDSRAKNSR